MPDSSIFVYFLPLGRIVIQMHGDVKVCDNAEINYNATKGKITK